MVAPRHEARTAPRVPLEDLERTPAAATCHALARFRDYNGRDRPVCRTEAPAAPIRISSDRDSMTAAVPARPETGRGSRGQGRPPTRPPEPSRVRDTPPHARWSLETDRLRGRDTRGKTTATPAPRDGSCCARGHEAPKHATRSTAWSVCLPAEVWRERRGHVGRVNAPHMASSMADRISAAVTTICSLV